MGSITFYRNGVSLGTAFANVRMLQQGAAYFPGLSLSQGERCDVNFGQTPFVYPVEGHKPLQAPPPPAAEGYYRTITCALARLLILQLRRCANAPAGAAGCGSEQVAPVTAEEAAAAEARLWQYLQDCQQAEAAAAANAHHRPFGGGMPREEAAAPMAVSDPCSVLAVPGWPGDDAFALLAGLLGDHLLWLLDHSEWWLHSHMLPMLLHTHGLEPPHAGGAVRALVQLCQLALPAEGFGKLVGVLGRVLGHYASMAPFQRPVGDEAGGKDGDAAMEEDERGQQQGEQQQQNAQQGQGQAQGQASAPVAKSGIFHLTRFSEIRQLAFTGAYPFTSALAAATLLPDAASAWAHGPQWLAQMEAVLTRKLPTLDDLKELMPHVPKFTATGAGADSAGGAATAAGHPSRVRMQGGEAFRADVRQLTAAMRGIEANQMELAAAAAGAAPPAGAPPAPAPPLLRLVRHVLRRNRHISSSSPPSGLSDGTVLTSLFYLLLRMLEPYASGARPSRSLHRFPAGRLFVHSAAAAEPPPPPPPPPLPAGGVGALTPPARSGAARGGRGAQAQVQAVDDGVGEVLSDMIRVGGLTTHLDREARVCDEVLQRHGGRVEVPDWYAPRRPPRGASGPEEDDAPALADEWLPELLSAALVLYTWRVSGSVQSGTAMAGVMEANIGGMQELSELERMLGLPGNAGGGGQASTGPVAAARSTVQSEVESSTRYVAITQVVLFSGWKAAALLSMSAYVMAMLTSLAALGGGGVAGAANGGRPGGAGGQQQQQQSDEDEQLSRVLLYVPVAFVSAPLELLLALQAAGSPFAAASCRLSEAQLSAFVGFVVACLRDERVVHPDVRELVMRALSTLLESSGCISAMERHPAAISSLVPRLMGSFSGEHWQEVALALLRLVGGAGMGELLEPPAADRQQQALQRQQDAGAASLSSGDSMDNQQQQLSPLSRRHGGGGGPSDWRQRLIPAQRVDSAGAALTVVEAVAAHVGRRMDSLDSLDVGSILPGPLTAAGGSAAGRPSSGSDLFRRSFGSYASHNLEAAARFLGQLYDSLNSVLTESASLVVELHRAVGLTAPRTAQQAQQPDAPAAAAAAAAAGGGAAGAEPGAQPPEGEAAGAAPPAPAQAPPGPPQPPPERLSQTQLQQRYRRAAALVDVSIALLRLLEATARDAPAVFLCGDTAPLATSRLIELLAFVLRHYCCGAEARRLGELLRQRSLALARHRQVAGGAAAAVGGTGGAGGGARMFPAAAGGGAPMLNFNLPVPGIGNLTFLVHAQVEEPGGPAGQGQGEEGDDDDEGGDGSSPRGAAQSPVERLARAAVLAPVAGTIVNLVMAEQLPDEGASDTGGAGAGVRLTAALVGTKQLRQRPEHQPQCLCPRGQPRRRSFVDQLAASDIPMESLQELLTLDWLQLEASRKLLRPERTAGAVAGLLLQDSNDLRSGADALREERRRSQAASPTHAAAEAEAARRGGGGGGSGGSAGGGSGSPQPMDVDGEAAAAGPSGASAPPAEAAAPMDIAGAWAAATAAARAAGGGEPGPALRQQLDQLEGVLDAVARRRTQMMGPRVGGGGAGGVGGTGVVELEAPPDEFMDPLTAMMMEEPVILPASRMVVDRSTIARHLAYQATDPFSRSPLKLDDVIPDEDLAARIREWQQRTQHT